MRPHTTQLRRVSWRTRLRLFLIPAAQHWVVVNVLPGVAVGLEAGPYPHLLAGAVALVGTVGEAGVGAEGAGWRVETLHIL